MKKIGETYIDYMEKKLQYFENQSVKLFERNIAQMNKAQCPDIESIFLMCNPAFTAISSTIVRDSIRNGGDASQFVPSQIKL